MNLGSLTSEQDALKKLSSEVEAAFGERADDGRAIILASAAEALWLLSQQLLDGIEAEPDFIGSEAVRPS